MKPLSMIVKKGIDDSFVVKHAIDTGLYKDTSGHVPLHIHKEYEIMLIIKGSGTRVVGSSIDTFEDNDLVITGPDLPHVWRSEKINNRKEPSEYAYTCFSEDTFGQGFFTKPELKKVNSLLKDSSSGIRFTGPTIKTASVLMQKMARSKDAEKFICLLQLLSLLAGANDKKILNSKAFSFASAPKDSDRINKIMLYILENYQQDITVEQISDKIGMVPNAFSRFFKSKTFKHFSEFLNEVRIANATRLLSEKNMSISDVALHCGYNSISNFNRQFKRNTGRTPLDYKQEYLKTF